MIKIKIHAFELYCITFIVVLDIQFIRINNNSNINTNVKFT